jgi:hypothetical protein
MSPFLTFLVAIAFAVLVVAVLMFISKVAIGCAAVVANKEFTSKLSWEVTGIFLSALIIALYFLF